MLPESALRAVVETIPSVPVHGPFSRCVGLHHLLSKAAVPAAGPPQPLWGMGSKTVGGRYTPRNLFETVYIAEDIVTALTEVTAVVRTGSSGLATLATNPWALISVRGVLLSVLNLIDPAILVKLGTTAQELTGEWRYTQAGGGEAPTQLLGRVCYDSERFDAIRYPSTSLNSSASWLQVNPIVNRIRYAICLQSTDTSINPREKTRGSKQLNFRIPHIHITTGTSASRRSVKPLLELAASLSFCVVLWETQNTIDAQLIKLIKSHQEWRSDAEKSNSEAQGRLNGFTAVSEKLGMNPS